MATQAAKKTILKETWYKEDAKLQFQMFEATTRENKATNYTDALTGWRENSTLSACFFSASKTIVYWFTFKERIM